MAVSYLLKLPCELLYSVGLYLGPVDLQNYLAALVNTKVNLNLADFTTVVTKDYSTLPPQLQIQLEANKPEPNRIPEHVTVDFCPDFVELTLVNGIADGPVRYYQVTLSGPVLVGQGQYLNGYKSGLWKLQQSYLVPGEIWHLRLKAYEEGYYWQDRREGEWSIQAIRDMIMVIKDLVHRDEINIRVGYQAGQKFGHSTIQDDYTCIYNQIVHDTSIRMHLGHFLDDMREGEWNYLVKDDLVKYNFFHNQGGYKSQYCRGVELNPDMSHQIYV